MKGFLLAAENKTREALDWFDKADLDQEKAEGDKHADEELSDLNLYFHIFLGEVTTEDTSPRSSIQ